MQIFIKKYWLYLLPLCGLWFMSQGAYIHTKAVLAQFLLETAWSETLDGQKEVKPWPWADTWPVARLSVPQLGISHIVLAGATGSSLAFGPGHLFNSARPDESGNIIVSGHRDTHFAFLKHININDALLLETAQHTQRLYKVTQQFVVDTNRTPFITIDETDKLILITCYPFHALTAGGSLRYVVIAEPEPVITS